MKRSKNSPSPDAYKTCKDAKDRAKPLLQGKFMSSPRVSVNSEDEYLGSTSPPAHYVDIYNKPSPEKIVPIHKKVDRDWRIKKSSDPDVGSYNPGRSIDFTKKSSPTVGIKKGKRTFFSDSAEKQHKHVPGPGQYSPV